MRTLRLAASCLLLLWSSSCGGSDNNSGPPPDPPAEPNEAPVMTVPSGLSGTSPRYTFSLPFGGTQTLTFTAIDPDSDPLQWQVTVPSNSAAAAGVSFTTPSTGPSFTIEVSPVLTTAFAQLGLLLEDGHSHVVAIDLLVVRTGPPTITSVTPDNAFRNRSQNVTIVGRGMQLGGTALTTVGFDGFGATNVVVASDTSLTCSTPTSAQIGSTIVGVAQQYGTASLPESAFTMLEFPPAFAALDQRLDTNTVSAFQLAMRGATTHAVWRQGTDIVHRTSTNGGASWSAQQTLSGTHVATEPQVVITDDGVTVAWITGGTKVWLRRTSSESTAFLPAQELNAASSAPTRRLRLAQSGNRLYAAWLAGDAGVGAERITASVSSDFGATWSDPLPVNDGLANQSNHEIACDGAIAWLVFEDDRLGAAVRGIYAVRTTDGGGSWGNPRRLNLATVSASQPRLATAGNRVHACWLQGDSLHYNGSSDQGQSWSSASTTVRTGAVSAPSISGEADRVYMSYVRGGNTVSVSRFSPIGSAVQHVEIETAATTPAATTCIGCAGNYVFTAWRDGDPATGAARVQKAVSTDLGATFNAPSGQGDGTATQTEPQLVHHGARLMFGWLDSRGATAGVFINHTAQ